MRIEVGLPVRMYKSAFKMLFLQKWAPSESRQWKEDSSEASDQFLLWLSSNYLLLHSINEAN